MNYLQIGERVSVDRSVADALVESGAFVEIDSMGAFVLVEKVTQ